MPQLGHDNCGPPPENELQKLCGEAHNKEEGGKTRRQENDQGRMLHAQHVLVNINICLNIQMTS